MTIEKLYIGSWFQRTTLHLSEIYDFLKDAHSPLELDKKKLKKLQKDLRLKEVAMEVGNLQFVRVITTDDIEVKIYEDGLVVLARNPTPEHGLHDDIDLLRNYYEKELSKAFSYLFSLGAPIPKELANIKTVYPYFVVVRDASEEGVQDLLENFKQPMHYRVTQDTFEIYRGDTLYIIHSIHESIENVERFIHEQIFLREFKGQLHRYLNLHRIIWERIADVKEKGEIRGRDIGGFKTKIEGYSKSINLIEARINQMGSYIKTRESVMRKNPGLERFSSVLKFKHEALSDTLAYTKEIWRMTKNYVSSALDLFSRLQAASTENSVKNLTVITSMGVGATLIGLFTQKKVPDFTWFGVLYFAILVTIGITANKIMKNLALRKEYAIRDTKIDKDIS